MTQGKTSPNPTTSQELEEVFALFLEASKALEAQQTTLQAQIDRLSQELVAANSRLSSLLNSLPSGVILHENHIVIDFNPAALHIIQRYRRIKPGKSPRIGNAPTQFGRMNTSLRLVTKIASCKYKRSRAVCVASYRFRTSPRRLQPVSRKNAAIAWRPWAR